MTQRALSPDFVSNGDFELPPDALGHEAMADALINQISYLPPGAVIGIQGSWGRGKTDVLGRVWRRCRDRESAAWGIAGDPVWINPWKYGTADLLTPLVLALLERYKNTPKAQEEATRKRVLELAVSLVRAGLEFGLKALAKAHPGMQLLDIASNQAPKILAKVLGEKEAVPEPDTDAVARMGDNFADLVDLLLPAEERAHGMRLLVCVDDIDRCLPERQVALLEAFRFLCGAGAAATFLLAIDPTLARQAVITHYGTAMFDPDRYLDKMFHLRVNLPAVSGAGVKALVEGHLGRRIGRKSVPGIAGENPALKEVLRPALGRGLDNLADVAERALPVGDLRNPRVLRRIFDRLMLYATAGGKRPPLLSSEEQATRLLTWLGVMERWPDLRTALQGEQWDQRFALVFARYGNGSEQTTGIAAIDRLATAASAHELREIFRSFQVTQPGQVTRVGQAFLDFDLALVAAGL